MSDRGVIAQALYAGWMKQRQSSWMRWDQLPPEEQETYRVEADAVLAAIGHRLIPELPEDRYIGSVVHTKQPNRYAVRVCRGKGKVSADVWGTGSTIPAAIRNALESTRETPQRGHPQAGWHGQARGCGDVRPHDRDREMDMNDTESQSESRLPLGWKRERGRLTNEELLAVFDEAYHERRTEKRVFDYAGESIPFNVSERLRASSMEAVRSRHMQHLIELAEQHRNASSRPIDKGHWDQLIAWLREVKEIRE